MANCSKITRPPPDLQTFYYARGEGVFAERWPHRHRVADFPALQGTESDKAVLPRQIKGYTGYPCADGVRYARGRDAPTAFLDRGPRIDVIAEDETALLAALNLAVLKFDGKVSVSGSPAFRERMYALAKAHGLSEVLSDSDLVIRRVAEANDLPQKGTRRGRRPSLANCRCGAAEKRPAKYGPQPKCRSRGAGHRTSQQQSERVPSDPVAAGKRIGEQPARRASEKPGGLFDLANTVEKPQYKARSKGKTEELSFPLDGHGKGHGEGR